MGMVVRTNVMAMNAFRQLNMNNSQVGKSLEKLSSGFRINRAGDDASGLAISEKMKAQIKGLETASSNSQDGISLVQTAEGALTEVHDMLNRMVELAGKAANGTMDDPVDRKALQEEMDALKSEINRIAEGTNFNGIKLLDGSMGAAGTITETAGTEVAYSADGTLPPEVTGVNLDKSGLNDGVKLEVEVKATTGKNSEATTGSFGGVAFTIKSGENSGTLNGRNIEILMGDAQTTATKATAQPDGSIIVVLKGDDRLNDYAQTGNKGTATAASIQAELRKLGSEFANVTVTADNPNFAGAPNIGTSVNATMAGGSSGTDKEVIVTAGGDTFKYTGALNPAGGTVTLTKNGSTETIDLTLKDDSVVAKKDLANVKKEDGTGAKSVISFKGKKGVDVIGSSFTVDGKTFEFVKAGEAAKNNGATAITIAEDADDAAIAQELSAALNAEPAITGTYTVNVGAADTSTVEIVNNDKGADSALAKIEQQGAGLTLQIGDTADSYNQISVSINAMSTKGLGIEDISVASRTDASAALKALRDVETGGGAINVVSAQRAKLGALQNRLEHTINNLDVAAENMTSANMRIRDTDMAKEMMAYTKMNVLTQAAQAMLAQANQQPQSVLQLLQ